MFFLFLLLQPGPTSDLSLWLLAYWAILLFSELAFYILLFSSINKFLGNLAASCLPSVLLMCTGDYCNLLFLNSAVNSTVIFSVQTSSMKSVTVCLAVTLWPCQISYHPLPLPHFGKIRIHFHLAYTNSFLLFSMISHHISATL